MKNNNDFIKYWVYATPCDLIGKCGLFIDGDWIETKDQDSNGDIRLIQLADIGDGVFRNKSSRFLTKKRANELGCTYLESGDVLIARMPDPIGRSCIFPLEGRVKYITVVDVCILRLNWSYFNNKFISFAINSPEVRSSIGFYVKGSTRKRISRGNLASISLPIAPTNEQHRIVAKIEELFSLIDEGVESLRKAREQLAAYRQSLLEAAFTGRLSAAWRRENAGRTESAHELLARIKAERAAHYRRQLEEWEKATAEWQKNGKAGRKPARPTQPRELPPLTEEELADLPPLPEGWGWCRIADIALVGTGVTPLKSRLDFYSGGTIPWITSGSLNSLFITQPSFFITDIALEETNLKLYPKGTLLVAMYGEGKTRGKCSELSFDATINQAIAAIMQDGLAVNIRRYLKWFLQRQYEALRLMASGGVQPNLNLDIVQKTLVPLCSISEQEYIVTELECKFSELDNLTEAIEKSTRYAETFRQVVLKKAFSGQLVPQDPHDEPAAVLLERIRAERQGPHKDNNLGSVMK